MPKIAQCNHCLLYARNPHLICAIHPEGVNTSSCLDFRQDPRIEEEEIWEPEGASYYNGELIVQPKQTRTKEEKLELLDNHPFFTGICTECGYTFDRDYTSRIHFDCPNCGWVDDSL